MSDSWTVRVKPIELKSTCAAMIPDITTRSLKDEFLLNGVVEFKISR